MRRFRRFVNRKDSRPLRWPLQPAARLNGSSDLAWELRHPELFEDFPEIQFFDYTKVIGRMRQFLDGRIQDNYHLTFSTEHDTMAHAQAILKRCGNVAIAFWPELPDAWLEFSVIDADAHDARFLDTPGTIAGLRAKGPARVDISGFTVRPCPRCSNNRQQLQLLSIIENTHRVTEHQCNRCGFTETSSWKLAA